MCLLSDSIIHFYYILLVFFNGICDHKYLLILSFQKDKHAGQHIIVIHLNSLSRKYIQLIVLFLQVNLYGSWFHFGFDPLNKMEGGNSKLIKGSSDLILLLISAFEKMLEYIFFFNSSKFRGLI